MPQDLIAVVDVGKTHAKLSLIDAQTGVVTWSTQCDSACGNKATPALSTFRQLDAGGVERWLIDSLKSAPGKEGIGTIVPVAHGAAAGPVEGRGRLLGG